MVNGTKPRERLTTSGWPWVVLNSSSTDLSLYFPQATENRDGLPQRVDIDVKRIVRERGHWPTSEVVIAVWPPHDVKGSESRRVYRSRLSLLSSSGKRDCVKVCKDTYPPLAAQWAEIVETLTDAALSKSSERVNPVMLGNLPIDKERPKYLVEPLLEHHQLNLLWGDSDVGKSWVGIYLCAIAENGITANGLKGGVGRSLYVDYETSPDEMNDRIRAVRAGLWGQLPDDWEMAYQRVAGPPTDWIDELGRYVAKNDIELVVIDSLGGALAGVVIDSESVLKMYGAIRELNCTSLLIDHQGKGDDANQRGAIGSSYKRHYTRSEWEMRREDGDDFKVGLYRRKANNAKRASAFSIGLNIEIEEDEDGHPVSATFTPHDVNDSPDLAKGLSIAQRIRSLLRDGKQDIKYIRENLSDKSNPSIDSELSRMVKKGQLKRFERGLYGLLSEAF